MKFIYREVSTKERSPKEEGYYFGYSEKHGNDDSFWFSTVGSSSGTFSRGRFRGLPITHWIEKIEVPTNLKIEKEFACNDCDGIKLAIADSKVIGAKWLRDFVLSVTPNELQK